LSPKREPRVIPLLQEAQLLSPLRWESLGRPEVRERVGRIRRLSGIFLALKRVMRLRSESVEVTPAIALRAELKRIADCNDSEFHDFQVALVSRYRGRPDDQEWIAVELARRSHLTGSSRESARIEEILAMLEHVHDPLISASALNYN